MNSANGNVPEVPAPFTGIQNFIYFCNHFFGSFLLKDRPSSQFKFIFIGDEMIVLDLSIQLMVVSTPQRCIIGFLLYIKSASNLCLVDISLKSIKMYLYRAP